MTGKDDVFPNILCEQIFCIEISNYLALKGSIINVQDKVVAINGLPGKRTARQQDDRGIIGR